MKDHESFAVHAPSDLIFGGFFKRGLRQVRRWQQLHRERAELMRLSDAQLHDIGLSRIDVMEEFRRPFWADSLKK